MQKNIGRALGDYIISCLRQTPGHRHHEYKLASATAHSYIASCSGTHAQAWLTRKRPNIFQGLN
jgi:hypothetical protein